MITFHFNLAFLIAGIKYLTNFKKSMDTFTRRCSKHRIHP